MNYKYKIQVSVAVYNAEFFLHSCIDSILNQTFPHFRLLLINDGSSDNSGDICDYYARKDNRVHVIHQHNQGLSAVRNLAINLSEGEYTAFVDNDDTIKPDMLATLLELCESNNAEIAMCMYEVVDIHGKVLKAYPEYNKTIIKKSAEAIKETYEHKLAGFVLFNKLFKTKLFNSIIFPLDRDFQDAAVLYQLFHQAKNIVMTDTSLYCYLNHGSSTTASLTNKIDERRFQIVHNYQETYSFMKENYPELCDLVTNDYYKSLRTILIEYIKSPKETRNELIVKKLSKYIDEIYPRLINNPRVSTQQRVFANFFRKYPILAKTFYSIKLKTAGFL